MGNVFLNKILKIITLGSYGPAPMPVKYGKLHLSQMTCFDYAVNHQSNNISYLKSNFLFSHGLVHIFIHHCIVNCHSTKNCKCLVKQSESLELLILMIIVINISKANRQNNEVTLTKMKLRHS